MSADNTARMDLAAAVGRSAIANSTRWNVMSVLNSLQNLSITTRVSRFVAPAGPRPSAPAVDPNRQADFRQAHGRLLRLFDALQQLAATLTSTEEINASPTSFSPFGPKWSGLSDALITLGGDTTEPTAPIR